MCSNQTTLYINQETDVLLSESRSSGSHIQLACIYAQMCAFGVNLDFHTGSCVCEQGLRVSSVYTAVLFGAVLMHVIAAESFYSGPLQIWQELGTEQWHLIREEVCLSLL